jgi:5-methylcytosine-specific restriction endonuclease McrA
MNDDTLLQARLFHSRLIDLLRVEFASLGAFLEALAEFDRRKLFRTLGHADLFAYLHKGMKLSRAAAHHRRAAAWLVQRFPEVLEPIREGKLCFTTAAVLASVATEENLTAVLPRFYGLSKQEALELAAELKPRTLVPTRTVVTRVETVRPVGPVAEVNRTVPEIRPGELWMPRTGVERTERERTVVEPMSATSSRMHVTVSREFLALLKKAKAGQAHVNPRASDEEVLTAALHLLIEKQAKRKACVPAKVKREVVKRDQGKCQWKMADGGVCGATVRLEVDHVVPRGKGGPSTVENCRVLCRAHNLEAARQAYGDAHMDLFTRGGSPGGGPLAREDVAVYEAGPRPPRLCRSQSGFGASSDRCAPGAKDQGIRSWASQPGGERALLGMATKRGYGQVRVVGEQPLVSKPVRPFPATSIPIAPGCWVQ